MPKFDKLRNMIGTGDLHWVPQVVTCAVVGGYTFDAAHDSISAIQGAGGAILATGSLSAKELTADGFARSSTASLRTVPAGGPYDIVLFVTVSSQLVPIVLYADVLTMASTGDLLIRPENYLVTGIGDWFQF